MTLGNSTPSRNLFVAGLPPTWKDANLEQLFQRFGRILSAKVMVDLHTAKSRCFGFVLFEKEASAVAAQREINNFAVQDCTLVVSFSTCHSTTHLVEKSNAIYVRNIPKGTDVTFIRSHFSSFGAVTTVEILPDTAAGASGRFIVAKVSFDNTTAAVEAEKATQCAPNVFAAALGGDTAAKSPPLLAKLAENHQDRVKRMAASRAPTARPTPNGTAQNPAKDPRHAASSVPPHPKDGTAPAHGFPTHTAPAVEQAPEFRWPPHVHSSFGFASPPPWYPPPAADGSGYVVALPGPLPPGALSAAPFMMTPSTGPQIMFAFPYDVFAASQQTAAQSGGAPRYVFVTPVAA